MRLSNKKNIFLMFFIFLFFSINCKTTIHYQKNLTAFNTIQLPLLILNDINNNKFSTGIFKEKEKSIIFIFNETKIIKTVAKPTTYAWRVFDLRNKPWYYPYFLYKKRFKKYKNIFLDSKNGLLDRLKLVSGNYKITIDKGYIESIIKLN